MVAVKEKALKAAKTPWLMLLFIGGGLFIGTVWALRQGNDLYVAVGGEIILLALGSMLINRHFSTLAKTLLSLGISFPLISAVLAPLYYPGEHLWFWSYGFWIMFGIGVVPGIAIFFLGVFLFTDIDVGRSGKGRKDPPWLWVIDWIIKLGAFFILLTLFIGKWNQYTLGLVYGGISVFSLCLIILIPYRFQGGLRGAGKVMLSLGIGGMLVTLWSWLGASSKVSFQEAALGFIPMLALFIIGLVIMVKTQPDNKAPHQ